MKATLQLTEEEIKTAVRQYVENNGWTVSKINLDSHDGCSNQRDYQAPYTTASVEVNTPNRKEDGYHT